MITTRPSYLSLLLICACASACQKPAPPPPLVITEESHFLTHIVSSNGETLGKISKWYTGEEKGWKEIEKSNPLIRRASLRAGDRILIPMELVHNTEPLLKVTSKPPVINKKKTAHAPKLHAPEKPGPSNEPDDSSEEISGEGTQIQPHADLTPFGSLTKPDLQPVEAQRDIPVLPSANETPPSGFAPEGKSMEQMILEEQAEVEKMKKELSQPAADSNPS